MYPSGETKNESLLPAGPSSGPQQQTSEDVDLEGIVVDNPSNDPQKSLFCVAVPKPRPLNLADNYEIVGGVPAFVWRPHSQHSPSVRLYSISSDGTRLAIQEDFHKICVYDMLDNYSLVAKWEDTSYEAIQKLIFHNKQNNELVVVFDDSTVALMFLAHEFRNANEQAKPSLQQIGTLEIKEEFRILDEYKDIGQLAFSVHNYGPETWVCALDYNIQNIVTLCSIKESGFRRLQVKSDGKITSTFAFCSISQKAIMFVGTRGGDSKPYWTRIWIDLDFDNEINTESPIELSNRQGLGFNDCGSHFLAWNYSEHGEDAIEAYNVRLLKTSANPIAKQSIGHDVLRARGMFVQLNQASLEVLGYACPKESLIAAFLVASTNKVKLRLWDVLSNEVFKKFNLTTQEMTFSALYHIEFSISTNTKWVAIGSWTDGAFGLFSLFDGALIWSTKLNTPNELTSVFIPLTFDASSSRLIINACDTLYVFAPPFLLEGHNLEFLSTTLDLATNYEDSRPLLNISHQALIPKHILKQALYLQHGLVSQDVNGLLDITSSRISSNIALLVQRNGSLMVVQTAFKQLFASTFIKYIKSEWSGNTLPHAIIKLRPNIIPLQQPQDFASQQVGWIFLYPNEDTNRDSTVVFLAQEGLLGVFIDIVGSTDQVKIPFGNQECFALKQSKDSSRVTCLHAYGVTTIDLNKKSMFYQVSYRANLAQWLLPYIATRNQSCFEVSHDATTILIGWDTNLENPTSITSQMDNEECRTMIEENEDIVPCWSVSEDFKTIALLEFNEDNRTISSISTYSAKSARNGLKRVSREQWNLHTVRILDSLTQDALHDYALQLDEHTGHLWIIALQRISNQYKLILTPISPYSLDGCTPSLYMRDYPSRNVAELKELALGYGNAFFTMYWNGKTNFQLAFEHKDKATLIRLVDSADGIGISSKDLFLQSFGQQPFHLIENAIDGQSEASVAFLLDLAGTKAFSFEDEAMMLREGFEGLWLDYRTLLEPKILYKTLEWKTCELKIPIDVFSKDANVGARVGTSDSMTKWQEAFEQGRAFSYWRSLHRESLKEMGRRWSKTTTTSIVVFFAIANICKIGLNGIVRFLLMQDAPSYIFKTPLLKWVIAYKWEKVWKRKSFKSFIFYLCFVALYSIYSIWIALSGKDLNKDIATSVRLTILLFLLMTIASKFLYQEYLQVRSCIEDGKELFPHDHLWGLRKYISSIWNLVEVLTYLILIVVIPILHFANLGGVHVLPILYTFVALETFLVCIKVWYYAQAFEGTGAFVLMIESIVKDCAPFLALAFAILVAFSFSLFVLFQHSLQEKRVLIGNGEEDEVKTDLDRCFGDPAKAMVTLFYAMIGTFEPKVYYHSGSLSQIITLTFVVYLAIQMIVMVNMLIAIMGDTFDRVKSTEEEQLLMGRARFIDACEAQLSEKQIEEIENSIGKYLYVLFPKDGDITEDMRLWQGRVKTIEERVGKMITESQNTMMDQIKEDKKQMNEDMDGMKENIDNIEEDTNNIKEDISGMKEDISGIKDDISGTKKDMIDMKEVLQLIKDKVLE